MSTRNKKDKMQPIQMIPLRRCGSHAIRLRLSKNPKFYSPYPLHLVDFIPLLSLYGDLNDDKNYFQLIVDVVGLQALSLVKWQGVALDPIKIFERIKNKPRNIYTINWEILFTSAELKSATVVMDKSLDNVKDWKTLIQLYPSMLFINLVRDPRAQIASINRAIIHNFDTLLNAQLLVENYYAATELIKAHPKKVLTVRFEDFLMNSELEIKKICRFTGLDFLPEMLDVSNSDEAREISKQSSLWESNSSPPILKNIDKFKKELTEEEIQIIETLCGEIMDRYEYPRISSGSKKITASTYDRANKKNMRLKKLSSGKIGARPVSRFFNSPETRRLY